MGEHSRPRRRSIPMKNVTPFFLAVGMERGSEQDIRLAADPTA